MNKPRLVRNIVAVVALLLAGVGCNRVQTQGVTRFSTLMLDSSIIFEGSTNDAYETTMTVVDPTADRTITVPNSTGTIALNPYGASIEFEGDTADDYETTLAVVDPTADRTVTIPDETAAVMVSSLTTNGTDIENSVTGRSNALVWEGATADAYEAILSATDPTADRSIVLPDAAGTVMLSSLATNGADAANAVTGASNGLVFEGANADAYETTLTVVEPTADRTATFPDQTGYVQLWSNANTQDVNLVFEGATANAYETTVTVIDPTADRTITIPNNSGTVSLVPSAATNTGAVMAGVNTVAYTDTTNKTMFVIPANADIVDIVLVVTTAFDDTGTDLLSCGYTVDTPNEYMASAIVSTAGVQRMGADSTMPYAKVGDVGSSDVTVLCKYVGQNGNSSAGAATVQILYRID